MSVRVHITGEGESFEDAIDNAKHIADVVQMTGIVYKNEAPQDGTSMPVKIGEIQIGVVSIEDDAKMNGRMPLRKVPYHDTNIRREYRATPIVAAGVLRPGKTLPAFEEPFYWRHVPDDGSLCQGPVDDGVCRPHDRRAAPIT